MQFTAAYLIRMFNHPRPWVYAITILNLIDLLAILPFWIELILVTTSGSGAGVSGIAVVRVLRLARILRLFKLAKNSEQLKLVTTALGRAREGITLLLFLFTLAAVFYASLVFFSESAYCDVDPTTGLYVYNNSTSHAGTVSQFQDIFGSMWWAIVTMSTVGYGDAYPVSAPGKIVGVVAMLSGLLVVAFPITIIGNSLNEVYAEFKIINARKREERRIRDEAKARKKWEKRKAERATAEEANFRAHDVDVMSKRLQKSLQELDTVTSTVTDQLTACESIANELRLLNTAFKEMAGDVPIVLQLPPQEDGDGNVGIVVNAPDMPAPSNALRATADFMSEFSTTSLRMFKRAGGGASKANSENSTRNVTFK